jgi:hypothetical protein
LPVFAHTISQVTAFLAFRNPENSKIMQMQKNTKDGSERLGEEPEG